MHGFLFMSFVSFFFLSTTAFFFFFFFDDFFFFFLSVDKFTALHLKLIQFVLSVFISACYWARGDNWYVYFDFVFVLGMLGPDFIYCIVKFTFKKKITNSNPSIFLTASSLSLILYIPSFNFLFFFFSYYQKYFHQKHLNYFPILCCFILIFILFVSYFFIVFIHKDNLLHCMIAKLLILFNLFLCWFFFSQLFSLKIYPLPPNFPQIY